MSHNKTYLNVFNPNTNPRGGGDTVRNIPWWLMRQAGRYLPEYRALRADAGGFLDLVYNSDFACEVTLQPIRRYGMSAAILFSDILVIPQALGQDLRFEVGEGPRLGEFKLSDLGFSNFDKILNPVYDTVAKIRTGLTAEDFHDTSLIGFCGAPWTVACYMIEGRGSKDFQKTKTMMYTRPAEFAALIDLLCDASIRYLSGQIEAGAEAVQIFDSWAGLLDEVRFAEYVIAPTRRIITALKAKYPDIPVIGFPRGAGGLYLPYVMQTGIDGVSLDPSVPLDWAATHLQDKVVVQGNLDPLLLLAGGTDFETEVHRICKILGQGRFIFNLGHGIVKETDPAHVAHLSRLLKDYK